VAEDLLQGEGFTEVQYIEAVAGAGVTKALASGEAHLSLGFSAPFIIRADAGDPIVMLAGVHVGGFELFGSEGVRAIRDLKGKIVAVEGLQSSQHVFLASMVAYVGLDPGKDIHWVTHPRAEAMQLFAEGKIDAYLGFPPDPQHLRGQKIGHVVVNSTVDRPWSQYFCCMAAGNQEFVRKHPVATKRALRAILKAADVCAIEPERAAQTMVDKGFTPRYEYALQTMQEIPYNKWREYDPGGYGAVLRPAPARGRDDQSEPPEARRPGHRLALLQRTEEGVKVSKGAEPGEQAGEHRVSAVPCT
jgi:NitT/TauT family transport system substrate-binding protein